MQYDNASACSRTKAASARIFFAACFFINEHISVKTSKLERAVLELFILFSSPKIDRFSQTSL
jgi:hypothetical protein